jgi:hypothetical protein
MVKEEKTYKRILEDFGIIKFKEMWPTLKAKHSQRNTRIPVMDKTCKMTTWEGVINKL